MNLLRAFRDPRYSGSPLSSSCREPCAYPHHPPGSTHCAAMKEERLEESLQACVFGFGLLENGNVGVGVLPEGKKILIGSARFGPVRIFLPSGRTPTPTFPFSSRPKPNT